MDNGIWQWKLWLFSWTHAPGPDCPLHPPTLSSWGQYSGLRTWATERNWIKQFLTRREQAAVGPGVRDPAPPLPQTILWWPDYLINCGYRCNTALDTDTNHTAARNKLIRKWHFQFVFRGNTWSAPAPDKLFTERSCLRPKSVRLGLERFRATVPGDRFTEIDLGKCCFEWVVSVPLSAPLTLHSLNLEEKNFYTRIN